MHRYACLAAGLGIAACEAPTDGSVGPTVRDSAGVRVVEHTAALMPTPAFALGEAPRVRWGLAESGDLTLFGVEGGALLPGAVVVADGGNHRLIRWALDGELLGMSGTRGEGPGEFRIIAWLQATAEGLALYDGPARRISWFGEDGTFLRSMQLRMDPPTPRSVDGIVASGASLAVVGPSEVIAYPMAYADPTGSAGPLPVHGDLAVYDSASTPMREIGRTTLIEWYEDPDIEGFPLANRMEMPTVHWSARDDLMAITDVVRHRVDVLELGRRRTVILEELSRIPFVPDSIPEEYHLAADSLQAYRDVRVDARARLWVKPAVAPGIEATTWRVFDVDGMRVGQLSLPTDATILDATADLILLSRRSELDVESVELWDLTPPEG
jgi:hypothetical protein